MPLGEIAMERRDVAVLRWNMSHPGGRRLGRSHRFVGTRRWDAPLQKVLMDAGYNQH